MNCKEMRELITANIDNEISASERKALSDHLKKCHNCNEAAQFERELKSRLVHLFSERQADASIRESIQKMLFEQTSSIRVEAVKRFSLPLSAGFVLAGLALLALYIFSLPPFSPELTPRRALAKIAKMHNKIASGELLLQKVSSHAEDIEEFLKKSGDLGFEVMVHDLTPLGYNLKGSSITRINSRPAACIVYEVKGKAVVSVMLSAADLGDEGWGREVIDEKTGMKIYVSRQGRLNSVAWWRGDTICIIVSDLPEDELTRFALAEG